MAGQQRFHYQQTLATNRSQVFVAWDTVLQQQVVVKHAKNSSLIREYQALQVCASRGIGEALELDLAHHALVLRYYQHSRNLLSYGTEDLSELADICLQVVERIAYCHHCGYIHGDIKPSNILVLPNKEVVLIDFGSALPLHTVYADLPSYEYTPITNVSLPHKALPIVDWQAFRYYVMMATAYCPLDNVLAVIDQHIASTNEEH